MLAFQVFLLGGYAYAHLLVRHFSPRHQTFLHLALLAGSLVFLPITPGEEWKPDSDENPMMVIVLLLVATIGVPFLLISASGPLLQHWFNRVHPALSPYRLYALSNFGSLLGLVSYPFFIEPRLGLSMQSVFWSAGYLVYALICSWCAMPVVSMVIRHGESESPASPRAQEQYVSDRLLTLALAACGSVILLATTNQICRDVAVIPFLWVLPLSLYLISFILCFDHPRWYNRKVWVPVFVVLVSAAVYLLLQDYADVEVHLYLQIFIYSATLLACCMVCHGELVRLKPHASYLTSFYLLVALGGALGGVFVNFVAPLVFKGYWEFHFGLVAIMMFLGFCIYRTKDSFGFPRLRWIGLICWVVGIVVLTGFLGLHVLEQQEDNILTMRNFYGVLRVTETDPGTEVATRFLYHGRISHGRQFLIPRMRSYPTAYYGPFSGISVAIGRHPERVKLDKLRGKALEEGIHVGIIGLGVGTIAAYSKPGDTYRFYEINSDVSDIAKTYFTYLEDAKGAYQVVLGDGRVSLERELTDTTRQPFDILAVDAFSGDGIPVHLLTREAFTLYWRHLHPNGILAFHLTNRHFDLAPVVRTLARDVEKRALWITDTGNPEKGNDVSEWVLVTSNKEFLKDPFVNFRVRPWATPQEILWTDDYSNLFQVVAP